jgi:regulator of sigma E protease
MLINILAPIILIGLLIFVHEAGHLLVARWTGMKVDRFSLGFGHPIVRIRRGETEYCLGWIPLGGYVLIAGMEPGAGEAADPRNYASKPLLSRGAVIVAGVAMNFLFSLLLFVLVTFFIGVPTAEPAVVRSVAGDALPMGMEAWAETAAPFRIVRVGDVEVAAWRDLPGAMRAGVGSVAVVSSGGEERTLPLPVTAQGSLALTHALSRDLDPIIGLIDYPSAAAEAGLRPGDRVLSVNELPIASWDDLTRFIRASPGAQLALAVYRGGDTLPLSLVPGVTSEVDDQGAYQVGIAGIVPERETRRPSALAALSMGSRAWTTSTGMMVSGLQRMFRGQVAAEEIHGPLGIATMSAEVLRHSAVNYLLLIAILSIHLGLINLLPIPMLDGGHLLLLGYEAVSGTPPSARIKGWLNLFGMAVIITLSILAFGSDMTRLFA